jgi:ribosomal protein S18 acetylase RimI-like enzyme
MPNEHQLEVLPFSAAHIALVQDFDCGDDSWSRAAAEWIKAPVTERGALQSIKQHKTSVLLYFVVDTDDLVGFGSFGKTNWRLSAEAEKETLGYIPQLAVARRFQGLPRKPKFARYCRQIVSDLLRRCVYGGYTVAALHVHADNSKAATLYREFGFIDFDTTPGGDHRRMSVKLLIPPKKEDPC